MHFIFVVHVLFILIILSFKSKLGRISLNLSIFVNTVILACSAALITLSTHNNNNQLRVAVALIYD